MNFKQIKKLVESIASANAFVHGVYFDDIKTFAGRSDKKYYAVNFDLLAIPLTNLSNNKAALVTFSFTVTICGLYDHQIDYADLDVISDAGEIAIDLIAALNKYDELTIQNTTLNPFTDSGNDRTCGVSFNLSIQTIAGADPCLIPNN
jgi:hypothetical protein